MNRKPIWNAAVCALFISTAAATHGQTVFSQATTGAYAIGSNAVDKSASSSPNDLSSFTTAVAAAFDNNLGGVFTFGTPFPAGTTVLRGTFGPSGEKQLDITSSQALQTVANNGSFTQISDPVGIAQNADSGGYTLTFGAVQNTATGEPLANEGVTSIGFTVLSRTHGTYPCDVRATVTFADASTATLTASIGNPKGADDTFFGFTAPAGKVIQSLDLRSYASGTETPVNTRIALDDFGFIVSATAPPPVIQNLSPINHAIHKAENGIRFTILAGEPVLPEGISLTLNGTDVSSQLQVTGPETEPQVVFNGLAPDTSYTMALSVSNRSGITSLTQSFNTATQPFTLYNSEGFTSDDLYPVGLLQPVSHGLATWEPHPSEPAEVLVAEEPQGKVLQKMNVLASRADWLHFPPVASGTLIIELDAFVSTTSGRTIDLTLSPVNGAEMASFVAWGGVADKLAWFDNSAWLPISDLQTGWHHYRIVNYLSGPAAGFFDVFVDDVKVGDKLAWRNATPGTPLGRLRFHSQDVNPAFEYGQIDNLVITAAPEDPNAFPPPQIVNLRPGNNGLIRPTEGFGFDAVSALPIPAANITVTLNGVDVTQNLAISGAPTSRTVSFSGLQPGRHTVEISVSNAGGTSTATQTFIATVEPFVLFDSGGFASDELYPEGPLQPVVDGANTWVPAAEPADIINVGDPHGKVLRRMQMGVDRIDFLRFTPVSSGILTIEFDARVSVIEARTLDMSLLHASSGSMASFIGWGTVADQFAYYNGSAWVGVANPGAEWRHYKLVNYISGPNAAKYDLYMDGSLLGENLPFRHGFPAGSSVGQLRIGAIRGSLPGEYGEVDNLVLTVQPLPADAGPVELTNPVRTATAFSFSFQSHAGAAHQVLYKNSLTDAEWNTLETVQGDGTVKTITDTTAAESRFYLVRTSMP